MNVNTESNLSGAFGYLDNGPMCMIALASCNFAVTEINGTCAQYLAPAKKMLHLDVVNFISEKSDHRTKLKAAIESVAIGGSLRAKARNIAMLTLRDDNSGFPIEKHFDWIVGKGRDGQILLFGDPCSEDDVAQRAKDAELIDFFQNAPIALHWLSGEGIVLWANQTELSVLGYTAEEYIGQPIMKFCPDEEELVLEIFKQLGSGNTIRDVPVRFRTKDGRIVDLLIDSNVKYDSDGKFAHTRCFIRDDTRRKIREVRAQLLYNETKRSLKMVDNFMSRSMHHMRTPLHVMRNSAELVLDNLEFLARKHSDPVSAEIFMDTRNILTRSDKHMDSAVTMIDDITDLAKLGQGQTLVVAEEPVHLETMARQLFGSIELPCSSAPSLEVDAAPISILSDPGALKKVIRHLFEYLATISVSNGDGKIILRISHKSGRCYFETIRRGNISAGMDVSDKMELENDSVSDNSGLPSIFHRYQVLMPENNTPDFETAASLRDRIEAGMSSHRENGLGIGLSLSYHIVSALGGDLRYSAKSETGDVRFWFSVPQKVPDSCRSDKRSPVVSVGTPDKRRKIVADVSEVADPFTLTKEDVASKGLKAMDPPSVLVVEDVPVCAKLICRHLNKINVATKWVQNGQEALEVLKSETGVFSLVLMDLRMPVMDGFEATKVIKHQMHLKIPVVALTGETEANVVDECEKVGFDEFKQKPLKKEALVTLVRRHTGYRPAAA